MAGRRVRINMITDSRRGRGVVGDINLHGVLFGAKVTEKVGIAAAR